MSTSARHVPVMRDRVIALLAPALQGAGAVLVDATLGLGGHAEHALASFPDLRLIGLDRDPEALRLSADRLAPFGERVTLVHAVYDELPEVLAGLGHRHVQGILFDLGVSSMQLDEADRGFAYSQDAPLDMRMDPTTGRTAAEILNTYSAADLARILRQYGEERFASRIAARVVAERSTQPFTTSARLVDLVREAIPAPARRTGGNPAKRTFQALRIEVNGELDALRDAIPSALEALAVGGRIVVMSYQSLEDRIVKRAMAVGAHPDVPAGLPVVPDSMKPWLRLVTRGAETASEAEVAENPRAASARVRAAERVAVAA
ncbi:MAG: rRNA (cytosine1402-N4)-methyltransferase [Actinomycetota bacterium]|jgi:16S rRNA (cytosine1402-N4)-methyltransferase|nr:rRNA (cytosine1402-N4)-methyltransferase [Actinomycetota bacterium]